MSCQTVVLHTKAKRLFRKLGLRCPFRLRTGSDTLVLVVWRQVDPPALALGDDRHHLRAHAAGAALGAHMVERHRGTAHDAACAFAPDGSFWGLAFAGADYKADRLFSDPIRGGGGNA